MALDTPTWLTEEFIKNALQDKINSKNITICELQIEKPIPKGNNYVCDIIRTKIWYRISDVDNIRVESFVIKAPMAGCASSKELAEGGLTEKEVRLYNEYLPKLDGFLQDEDYVTPKSYFCSEKNVLVLDDLNFTGYKMADRLKQLDYDHTVAALKSLAKFHAASVKLYETEPEFVEEIGTEMAFTDNGAFTAVGFDRAMTLSFKVLGHKLLETDSKKYAAKLINYTDDVWPFVSNSVKPDKGEFNVLNHGDFWVTNMLFKYDDVTGKPVSVKLIDLQLTRYCSPANDLLYFLCSSVQEEVRSKRLDDIIKCYLEELNINLERFSTIRRLTRPELVKQLKAHGFFGLFTSIALLPIMIHDTNIGGEFDLDKYFSEKDFNKSPVNICLKNKKCMNILHSRLPEFEKDGWL